MTNLIEKARIGRMNALSGMSHGPKAHLSGSRSQTQGRHKNVSFISSRARMMADTVLP